MINSQKIKAKIIENGLTQQNVAERLGIKQPTLNQKINNIRPMDLDEAEQLAIILCITDDEFKHYFFYH